jgi:hypothetical protein
VLAVDSQQLFSVADQRTAENKGLFSADFFWPPKITVAPVVISFSFSVFKHPLI